MHLSSLSLGQYRTGSFGTKTLQNRFVVGLDHTAELTITQNVFFGVTGTVREYVFYVFLDLKTSFNALSTDISTFR